MLARASLAANESGGTTTHEPAKVPASKRPVRAVRDFDSGNETKRGMRIWRT